jgi:capsular polysaccharide biosynthesis protein
MKLDVPRILQHLVRRFGLLVLLTLLGGAAGGVYDAVKTPTYIAKSYVVVTAAQGDSPTAVNFAQAYGRIATSGPVVALATGALGSGGGLAGVTASTSPDAPVIEISATGTRAASTADVANAVAQALVTYGTTHADSTRVSLSVLARAAVPASAASPKPPLEIAVGAAGGLLVGGLAVLAGVGGLPGVRRAGEPDQPEHHLAVPHAIAMAGQQPVRALTGPADLPPARSRTLAWYAAAGGLDEPMTVSLAARAQVPVAARARATVPTTPIEPTEILRPAPKLPAVGRAIVIYQEGRQ